VPYSNAYSITIDHTKVTSGPHTNYVFSLQGRYLELASTGNGGQVQSASGYDIVFSSDSGGTSLLNFERVSWTALGVVQFHVQIPSLSSTVDTVIYILVGNSAITTDQQNASTVWSAVTAAGIWHMETTGFADSSGSGNNGTGTNAVIDSSNLTLVGNSVKLTGNGYVDMGQSKTALHPASAITFGATVVPSTSSQTTWATFINQDYSSPRGAPFGSYAIFANVNGTNTYQASLSTGGSSVTTNSGVSVQSGTRVRVVAKYDGSNLKIYVDGVLKNTVAKTGSISYSNGNFRIGANSDGAEQYQGLVDEVRVYGDAKSDGWIATESANLSASYSGAGFFTSQLTSIVSGRASQVVVETIRQGLATAKGSQVAVEVLLKSLANVRTSELLIEVITQNSTFQQPIIFIAT
jgi:hypothetical protein